MRFLGNNAEFLPPLLGELTNNAADGGPVVYAPERGWERLKTRLVRDLSQDKGVLPVQMKITLQGLASLIPLTVRAYERAGVLHGLAAVHINQRVKHTASSVGLEEIQVRALLRALPSRNTDNNP